MTDLHKAAEMALDYIKDIRNDYACVGIDCEKEDALVDLLSQTLAQPEQTGIPEFPEPFTKADIEYAPHESWDEERKRGWLDLQVCQLNKIRLHKYARQLRELLAKALAQPEQEPVIGLVASEWAGLEEPLNSSTDVVESEKPVAWCELNGNGEIAYFDGKAMIMPGKVGNDCHPVPLYTAPPSKPWVSLTDEEIFEIEQDSKEFDYLIPHLFARAIEAALKERNN